jgi:hypothetical protein
VAQAAAIALKNLVKGRWVAKEATTKDTAAAAAAAAAAAVAPLSPGAQLSAAAASDASLPETDKAAVRDNLFEALAIAPPLVKSQIAECVKVVAGHDYPSQWPALAASVAAALSAAARTPADQLGAFLCAGAPEALLLVSRLHAALLALRALCRLFEFRDRGDDGPLPPLVAGTFPDLLVVARAAAALCGAAAPPDGDGEDGDSPSGSGSGSGGRQRAAREEADAAAQQQQQQCEKLAPFSEQLGEITKLAIKCFWSACYMNVPAAMMTTPAAGGAVSPLALGDAGAAAAAPAAGGAGLLEGWLELLLDLIGGRVPVPFDVPGSRAPDPLRDPEAAAEWPWWKARKWALHVASRLASRYGDPKALASRRRAGTGPSESAAHEALDSRFAEEWARGDAAGFGRRFLSAVLQGPVSAAGAAFGAEAEAALAGSEAGPPEALLRRNWVSPRALNLALKYVTLAVKLAAPWKALKPYASALVWAVALPAAAFDDADDELWQSDPAEFVRRSNDIMVEMYSPRAAAVNFCVELCRQRPATALSATMEAIGSALRQLMEHQGAERSCPATMRHVERRADGALLLAGSLADTLKRKPGYAAQIEPLLRNVVLPLFASPRGHLRARACWVAGQFADAQLSQDAASPSSPDAAAAASSSSSSTSGASPALKRGTGPVFDALFDAVIASLGDAELPVRIDAAVALRALVEAAAADDNTPGSASARTNARVNEALPSLLRTLLQLMSQVDNEDLVTALEALVERAGPGVAPFAAELTRELVAAFNRMSPIVSIANAVDGTALAAANGSGSVGAGGIVDTATTDTADDRDDDAAMAAFSVLRALLTIVDAVSAVPGAVHAVEPHLLPLVSRLVGGAGDEAPDVFEEGLDLLSFLTYHAPEISPGLWGLWPQTVGAFHEWAGEAYLENMFPPLSNLIRRDTATFVRGRNPLRGGRAFVDDLVAMASAALLGEDGGGPEEEGTSDEGSSDEYDLVHDFEEVAPAARLLSVALQSCCRLRREGLAAGAQAGGAAGAQAAAAAVAQSLAPIDAALPAIVNIAVDRLQGSRKRKLDRATGQVTERRGPPPPKLLREVLLRVVADALTYDAAAALRAIGAATGAGAEGCAKFFEVWITLATATKGDAGKKKSKGSSGDGGGAAAPAGPPPALENFRKAADKKSAVLGLAAALSAPPGSLPPAVEAGAGHVLSAALGLLSAWKEQRARSEEGGGGGGRDEDGGMLGWEEGSSSDEDEGEGDGDEDGDADVYVRRLAAAAAMRAAKVAEGGEGSDDDDESDDGWGSDSDADDEDEADSPLLLFDPRAALLSSVTAARQFGRLAGIEHDAGMRGALEALAAEVGGGSHPSSA